MNVPPQLNILHKLAVTPPSNSLFANPIDYLKWFLKSVTGLFDTNYKIRFANVQYFSSFYDNQTGIVNGRLTNIPTVVDLDIIKIESLPKTLTDISAFLAATSIIQHTHSEPNKITINTFRDKLKIETIRENKLSDDDNRVLFDPESNLLTIRIPDLYNQENSTKLLGEEFYRTRELIIEEFKKNKVIVDGFLIEKKMDSLFTSEKLNYLIDQVQQFINKPSVQKLIEEYLEGFLTIDYFRSQDGIKDQITKFTITALLHSRLKPNRFDYQIIVSKYKKNEPVAYGCFLINADSQLKIELLNTLQIALNIAFNNLEHLLAWYFPVQKNITEYGKDKSIEIGHSESNLIYKSSVMRKIDSRISKLARTDETVLILGETGVGKDLIALEIHNRSKRKDKPFLSVPLSSLSEQLIESELFGSEKDSYSGLFETRKSKFEQADGGTIYLPEISEIPIRIQIKLLEFLQYKFIGKIGENKPKLDVRLIFASNSNIEQLINEGKLRTDFYYRISVVNILVPSLRERKEDILPLSKYFIKKHSLRIFGEEYYLDDNVANALTELKWDGNVRQLENLIISALVYSDNKVIDNVAIETALKNKVKLNCENNFEMNKNFKLSEREFRKQYFTELINKTNGNISEIARLSGLTRQAIYKILNDLEIKY